MQRYETIPGGPRRSWGAGGGVLRAAPPPCAAARALFTWRWLLARAAPLFVLLRSFPAAMGTVCRGRSR